MRDNTIGTHRGSRALTAYDPIKDKPGTEAYNAVSGPQTAARGAHKFTKPGTTHTATSVAGVQVGNVFAGVRQPSVPRRNYIPTVSLDQV